MLLKKQEMTKLWIDGKHVPVTLLKLVPQEVIGHRTNEKDGYTAIIVGSEKKEFDRKKGEKVKYSNVFEFRVCEDVLSNFGIGSVLDFSFLDGFDTVFLKGLTKGKGFQGVIKRHGFSRGPSSHGSHFHRRPGSIGGMKPRRVNKGKKLPGHMGVSNISLKNVKIINKYSFDNESLVAVKGSVPGYYGSLVKMELK
ncbi:50S ribosomal protein L3 [Candidatus Vampirococcus lugosii]|uniref:50S ribosomal protein L3 n=2 Tax=Candidatus Vampirococcus lugosii TaxID=2789015 RepID=A0ABS5QLC9_9BACT|nr:50S ribosomal protein L3 [Candidatus Vampirococcus lugosii]